MKTVKTHQSKFGKNLVFQDVCKADEPEGDEEDEGDIDDEFIPCVKRYQDKRGEKTVGYRFLCSCPDGYTCPTKYEDDNLPEIEGKLSWCR